MIVPVVRGDGSAQRNNRRLCWHGKLINAASVVCRVIINTNVSAAKTISLVKSRSAMRATSQALLTILLQLDHWIPGIRALQHQLSAYQRRKSKENEEEERGWTDWAREYPVYHYTPLALRKPGWILYFCRKSCSTECSKSVYCAFISIFLFGSNVFALLRQSNFSTLPQRISHFNPACYF